MAPTYHPRKEKKWVYVLKLCIYPNNTPLFVMGIAWDYQMIMGNIPSKLNC